MKRLTPSSSVLTVKGYSFLKKDVTVTEEELLRKTMTVTPKVPPSYATNIKVFSVLMESSQRFYLPRSWATKRYGAALRDDIPEGTALRKDLHFTGNPRDHQIKAIQAFQDAGCGILCLPCGYGKTFTAIAIAAKLGLRFLVVVHKEFLLDQWSGELKALLPGIRIGRIQGERLDIGDEYDVSIAMIQTICSRTYPAGIFASFGLAIFDEAHHLGAEHFSQTLQRIQCKHMLGLTATPQRSDGLTKVFEWFLGPIVFQIDKRDADDSVRVEVLRFTSTDKDYSIPPTNYRGEVIRARLLNRIAEHAPRTTAILEWIHGHLQAPGRKLLILSDRREHLIAFEEGVKRLGHTSVSYYVGGMKQADLDKSAESQIILATYAMAAEGLNIPTLNSVLLATPKSSVEQSIGRILRQRPEERVVAPLILDVLDTNFQECYGQYNKRKKTYKSAEYRIRWADDPDSTSESEVESDQEGNATCLIADD